MTTATTLSREEYIEQAYFFQSAILRLAESWSTQLILEHMQRELLSTTRLPIAVGFMLAELKHNGLLGAAMAKLPHYFSGFQAFVIDRAESDDSKSTFPQALLILQREAVYKSGEPSPAGLFVYQIETISRNQLGYLDGLLAMESDGLYNSAWREFLQMMRAQMGVLEVAEMIYLRSSAYLSARHKVEPDYQPLYPVLFDEKQGRIADANRGRDPNFLYAALQRQLGFPEVPRPPKASEQAIEFDEMKRKLKQIENKLRILEGEIFNRTDPTLFVSKEPKRTNEPK